MAAKKMPWKKRGRRREHDLGDDVAAGLGDRDLGDGDEDLLDARRHPRGEVVDELGAGAGEVEAEHQHRDEVEQDRRQGPDDTEHAAGQGTGPRGDLRGVEVQCGGDGGRVEVGPEPGVDPVDHRGGQVGHAADEVGDLVEEQLPEDHGQDEGHEDGAAAHDGGRHPP